MTTLRLLSGGAAQGLVARLAPAFEADTGCRVEGVFGAVGAMRDRLVGDGGVDLVILTAALVCELAAGGYVSVEGAADLGPVETAVAVRAGDPLPVVDDAHGLRAAFQAADAIFLPDTERSTAGIHLAAVLASLGLTEGVRSRLRQFPNGATAMRELAASSDGRPIGATQVTEILATPGARLVAPLPPPHGLATVYTAAPCTGVARPDLVRAFIRQLTGPDAADVRREVGFAG